MLVMPGCKTISTNTQRRLLLALVNILIWKWNTNKDKIIGKAQDKIKKILLRELYAAVFVNI
jgi:hypothetical protein